MIHYKLYNSVNQLPSAWDELPIADLFLKTPFLKALEQSSPNNINSYFVGVFSSETLVGIAILQSVELVSDDIFRKTSDSRIKQIGKQLVSNFLKGNAIVVGNLMHTGQHGLFFTSEIEQDQFLEIVLKAVSEVSDLIQQNFGKKVRIIAFKDFFETDTIHLSEPFFRRHQFFKARVQPNMILNKRDSWTTMANYVSAFNKKYRRRYRTAIKKKEPISSRELSLEDLTLYNDQLYQLYENVSDNAGVNSFKLHKDHFYQLKSHLGDHFKVFGYFLDQVLVGVYSLIYNNDCLETYFLGYEPELQHQHQMYLNMLFDMAGYGISQNFESVIFARTAMEIKSSIGAKPNEMSIYLKHTNTLIANKILQLVVKFMNPVKDWEERHPF
ncbi:GNAT family N-acetyltransferase [Sediminibacter sp. Hel_I_10]|uniref:GNAT family N-acetyltransferase n=1 Tax=Sediminibacter sp. Hel_I_10 TaxID=1392490 RepID=UPI000479637C|nr:GNAT family N-acetyltransferase [Sediminibacter sp. Hel_I_10]